MRETPLIALLSDFGALDPYVGIMKGVISRIAPGIPIIDLTHEVPPGDVLRAAVYLWQSRQYFPRETVFLCVVDPGVGTRRRGVLLRSYSQIFIGPDNGIFSFIQNKDDHAWELTQQDYMLPNQSATFHGRDVFAPVAAYAALGVEADAFGPRINHPERLKTPILVITEDSKLEGEILFSDRFGNLLTSLGRLVKVSNRRYSLDPWVPVHSSSADIQIFSPDFHCLWLSSGEKLRWVYTFADLQPDECGFLVGSSGLVEIVANGRGADEILRPLAHATISLGISGK
jgi:hypothetical protein